MLTMFDTERKETAPAKSRAVTPELREKVLALLNENLKFMGSPIFRRKKIEQELFNFETVPELPRTRWYQPTRDEGMEKSVGEAPQLMNTQEERLMFYRYNYCKLRLSQLKRKIRASGLTLRRANEVVDWHQKMEHFREYLVRTNLALVLAMAKRTRLGEVDFAEVVSEGNMALLRAVEKFNVDRGFKFSTYACRAILKAFSRTSMKASRYRTRFPVEFEPEMEKSDWQDRRRDAVEEDCIDELKAIVDRNLAELSNIEQTVIRRRFNWKQADESPLTLEEVGRIIGVTKERVRQIQNRALAKIKVVMDDGVLRVRTRPPETAEEAATATEIAKTVETAEAAD